MNTLNTGLAPAPANARRCPICGLEMTNNGHPRTERGSREDTIHDIWWALVSLDVEFETRSSIMRMIRSVGGVER